MQCKIQHVENITELHGDWFLKHDCSHSTCSTVPLYVLNFWQVTQKLHLQFTTQVVEILPHARQEHISHRQYHRCWCPGDARSQGISKHDIDYIELESFGPRTLRVNKGCTIWTIINIALYSCRTYFTLDPAIRLSFWVQIWDMQHGWKIHKNATNSN